MFSNARSVEYLVNFRGELCHFEISNSQMKAILAKDYGNNQHNLAVKKGIIHPF